MADILSWTGDYDEGCFRSSGGSRDYWVVKTCEYGPDRYPWVLFPVYNDQGHVVRFTNADRAMDGAETWERDPAMFLATVEASHHIHRQGTP